MVAAGRAVLAEGEERGMRLKNFYLKPELCRVYRREVLIFRKVENSVKKLAISCGKLVIPRRHFGKSKNRGSAGLAPPDVVEGHQPTQNTAPLTRKKHRFLKIFSRLFHANIRKKIFHRRSRKSKNYEPAGKHSEGVVTEKESANFGVKGICFFVANNQESSDTRIGRGAGCPEPPDGDSAVGQNPPTGRFQRREVSNQPGL